MHYGDNIPLPVIIYLLMNEKVGRSFLQGDNAKTREQAGISPSVFSLSNLKGLFSNLLFHFELTSHYDLTWTLTLTMTSGGPCLVLCRGMSTGFDRWRCENSRQEKAKIYFWNFILWFRTVGSCMGEWHPRF
jgi:hypothetical protein